VKDFGSAPVIRVIASLLLALGALALFLLGRADPPAIGPGVAGPPGDIHAADSSDVGIDSVLGTFGIPERAIRKRSAESGAPELPRTERRVTIGPGIVPVVVNAALNRLAHRYGARAVASENIRLNTVTIHIELAGAVIHTVILKIDPRAAPATPTPPQSAT
jgi:hypothetical protein